MRRMKTIVAPAVATLLAGCATSPPAPDAVEGPALDAFVIETSATSVLGPDAEFVGSDLPDIGLSGLFAVRGPQECRVAVLHGGEDSLATRLATLKQARH